MKKIKIIKICFLLFFLFFVFFNVRATNYDFSNSTGLNRISETTGHSKLKIFKNDEDIERSIGFFIKSAISLVGLVFMVLLVYAGILWMTARGNDTAVEKAKKIMTESIIGLAIVVSAYAISVLIVGLFDFQQRSR